VKGLRILVADAYEVVRRGVRVVLESHPGWRVVGEAAEGRRAIALARRLKPDVATIGVAMSGGFEAMRRICAVSPKTRLVVLTAYESADVLQRAIEAGARAYVAKADAARTLVAAVNAVARQGVFVTPRVARLAGTRPLTAREREVLRLLAEGLQTREVADRLGIRPKTVETHRASLMRKLHLRRLADLVRYAVRSGLGQL
jgi:DNA-binding NarL/FixJ family response regulator